MPDIPTTDEIVESIATSAHEGIESVTADNLSVREHDLEKRLKALDHIDARRPSTQPHFGMRFTKLVPPGGGGS